MEEKKAVEKWVNLYADFSFPCIEVIIPVWYIEKLKEFHFLQEDISQKQKGEKLRDFFERIEHGKYDGVVLIGMDVYLREISVFLIHKSFPLTLEDKKLLKYSLELYIHTHSKTLEKENCFYLKKIGKSVMAIIRENRGE